MKGKGLLDRVKNLINIAKSGDIFKVSDDYNFEAKENILKYGNMKIYKIWVYRKPIESTIEKLLNFISLGSFTKAKEMNYETLFHLGAFVMVGNSNGSFSNILVEKNHVINITKTSFNIRDYGENIPIHVNINITLNELLNKAQNILGPKYFLYDAFNNNCQVFCKALLNPFLTPKIEDFIFQPLDDIIRNIPKELPKFARFTTDLASWGDRIIGNGLTGGRIPREQVLKAVSDYKTKLKKQEFDPKYDELLTKKQEIANSGIPTNNAFYMNKSESERARFDRNRQKAYNEYKQSEDERIKNDIFEMERPLKRENPILDVFTGIVGSVDPTGLATEGINALRGSLEGSGLNNFKIHVVEVKKTVPFNEALKHFHNIIKNNKKKVYKETKNYYKFRNIAKTKFDKSTFRYHKINNDIRLILGELKK